MESSIPPTSGQKPTSSNGLKEDILDIFRKRGYHEDEIKLLSASFDLSSELNIDLTTKSVGIELLISWDISPSALSAFILSPTDPKILKAKLSEQVANIAQRLKNLSYFSYLSDPYTKTGSKFLNMLILREENHEILLLKTAEIFQSLSSNIGQPHPEAALALEAFSPLLKILGLQPYSEQLADLAFLALKPEEYKITETQTFNRWPGGKDYLLGELKTLAEILTVDLPDKFPNLSPQISWRVKSLYSIAKKAGEANDALGIRIVVEKEIDCYTVRDYIIALLSGYGFEKIEELSDNYIAHPKKSGYQALHETFEKKYEKWRLEIQIKSKAMHYEAELGAYSHLRYKLAKDGFSNVILEGSDIAERYGNYRQSLQNQKIIFAFDVDGKIHKIGPAFRGTPTVLDFAFHLSRDLGRKCLAATIKQLNADGTWKNLRAKFSDPIENGDIIELEIGKKPLPINSERTNSATTELASASLELLRQGREIDFHRRFDELKSEGIRIFETTIESWKKDFISQFRRICPDPNLSLKFLYSIERVHRKLGFEQLGIFYTAIGLKKGKKDRFLNEILTIVRDSSLVLGYLPEELDKKEVSLQLLVRNFPGIIARLLNFTQNYKLELNFLNITSQSNGFSLITLKVKFNEHSAFEKFINKLSDLYRHIPTVSLLPLQKKVSITISRIKENKLFEVLEVILNANGNIVNGKAYHQFLTGKMKLEIEVSFPLANSTKSIEKIEKYLNSEGFQFRII
ncbi:MAG: hypothetical protein ACPL4K_04065 [Candidatus Margulisiibacteriota bacterium]